MKKNKKNLLKHAFTLVELIIVIAIIAVLAVAAFMVLTKWLGKSRDSRRLGDLKTIQTGLEVGYVDPDIGGGLYPDISGQDGVVLFYSGTLTNQLAYQGIVDMNVAQKANLQKVPKDPSDQNEYTYLVTADRKKFQIMAMLEGGEQEVALNNSVVALEYQNRVPEVRGYELGVLLESDTKLPVQYSPDNITGLNLSDDSILGDYIAKRKEGEEPVSGTGIQELEVYTQEPVVPSVEVACEENYTKVGESCVDATDPTITGVSTSEPACEVVRFSIDGASDVIGLDANPYSFDGGATWQSSNTMDYNVTNKTLTSGNIQVKDAAGNIYTHTSDVVSNDDYYCLSSNTIMTYVPDILPGGTEASKRWSDGVTTILKTNATSTTDGYTNTYTYILPAIDSEAAKFCGDLDLGGYTDWYLPAKDQLNTLYLNKLGKGFVDSFYWSSTEYNAYNAGKYVRSQNFTDGTLSNERNKGNYSYVRCIRNVN